MIGPQLAPPPVAASRGSAPAGGSGGDDAPGHAQGSEPTSFRAALDRRSAHRAPDHTGTDRQHEAAGPRKGELQTEDAADAGAPQQEDTTPVQGIAAAIAAVIVSAVPVVAKDATAPVTVAQVATASAGQPATTPAATATPPAATATPAIVPAVLDETGAVVPALTPAQLQAAPATRQTDAAVAGAIPAEGATDGATAASAATPPAPSAAGAPAPAATVTLTLTPTAPDAQAGQDAQAAPVVAPAQTAPAKEAPAPAPRPADAPAPAPAQRTDLPVGGALAPPQPSGAADPLGTVPGNGGMTTPHELARELGTRMHMAVREGGKELLVNLRPPELGHLTIRVTMTDGVLQAQITADRPEAAKLLQQSLGNLDSALGDLGYAMGSLDVSYGGRQDAHEASQGSDAHGSGRAEADAGDDVAAVPAATTTTAATGSPDRLDLLA